MRHHRAYHNGRRDATQPKPPSKLQWAIVVLVAGYVFVRLFISLYL
jgi:hypothetical protein